MTRNQIVMSVARRWAHKKLMFQGMDGATASLASSEPSFEEIGLVEDLAQMFELEGVLIESDKEAP